MSSPSSRRRSRDRRTLSRYLSLQKLSFAALATFASVAPFSSRTFAANQNQTYAGGNGIWDTGTTSDWSSPGTTSPTTSVWVAGDDATLSGSSGTLTINGTVNADSLTNNTNTGFTLAAGTGTPTLQLGNGSTNPSAANVSLFVNQGSSAFTINSGVTVQLMANQTWEPYNNSGIIINGNVTDAGAGTSNTGFTLTLANSSGFNGKSVQLNGTNTFGAISMTGGNSDTLTLGGSTTLYGNLAISGGSASNNDVLDVNSATLTSTTGALVFNSNYITLDSTKSGGNTVTSTLAENWNGNLLTYGGSNSLNMGGGGVTLGTNVVLNASSTTAANVLTLGGVISDGGNGYSFYKEGAGSVTLNGANTYTGGTTVAQGLLTFGNSTAADTGKVILQAGSVNGSTLAYGYDFSQTDLNKVVSNNAGTTIAEGSATAAQNLNFTNYSNVNFGATVNSTYSGTITPGSKGYLLGGGGAVLTLSGTNALTGSSAVIIGGGGTGGGVTLTAANNDTGATTISGFTAGVGPTSTTTLTLSGFGTDAGSTGFTIGQGGVLTISNTSSANSTARLGSTAPTTLKDGTFNFNNDASNNTFAQSTGNLNVGVGFDTIGTTQAGSTGTSTLTFAGLTRSAGSTLNFTDASVGANTRDEVIIGGLANNTLLPYATVNGGNFANYTTATGVTALSSFTAHTEPNFVSTDNVSVTANTTTTGSRTINSLTMSGVTLTNTGYTLDLVSGGFASTANTSTISGGNLTVGASNVGGELIVNSTQSPTISSVIQNNGTGVVSLTKGGSGTLTLSGSNTYTGGTTIGGGTLYLNNSNALNGGGLVTMAGGTLQPGSSASGNSSELNNNFFFAPGTSSSFQTTGSDFYIGGAARGTSLSAWTGSGTINFSNPGGTNSFQFNFDPSQFSGTINYTGGDNFYLDGQTSQTYMTLDGSKAHWIVNNTGNSLGWNGGAGGVVKMGDLSGSGNYQPNQNSSLEVGFLNDSTVYNGKIGNNQSTSLVKVGSGTLTLTGLNGGLGSMGGGGGYFMAGGTLASTTGVLSNIGVTFSGASTLALTSPATAGTQNFQALALKAGDATLQSIYGSGDTGNTNITFSSNTRSTGATANYVVTGGTNGSTNIINPASTTGFINQGEFFNGGNYAWMNGSSTYVRGINYSGDTGAATSAGSASLTGTNYQQITGAITGQNNATFLTIDDVGSNNFAITGGQNVNLNGFLETGGSSTISGGTLTVGSGQELVLRTNLSSDSLTISSNILANGTNALTKSGAGTLTLSGTNTYTGGTYINQGILNINADGTLGAVPGSAATNLTFSGTNSTLQFGAANIALNANRKIGIGYDDTATFDTNGNNATVNGVIGDVNLLTNGGGTTNNEGLVNKIGAGTLALSGANSYSGGTTLTAGTLALNNGGVAGPASQSVTLTNGSNSFTATSTTGLFVGEAVTGPGLVTGTEITAINTSSGLVTLSGQYVASNGTQTVSFGADSALGTGALTINGGSLDNTGSGPVTLATNNAQTWAANFGFAGTNSLNLGTGAVTITGNRTVTTAGTGALTVGGVISDGNNNYNSYGLTAAGSGDLILSGANTYTGTTTFAGGTLTAGAADVTGVSGAFGNGGNLIFTGGILQYTAASASTAYSSRILNSSSAIAIDTNNQVPTLTALGSSNTGGLSVVNTAAGTTGFLTLAGANVYTGATTIGNHGALNLTGSIASGSAVTVQSGGTLTGTGTAATTTGITGGAVTANGGGTISTAAALSSQALTVNGLTLGNSSTYTAGQFADLTFTLGTGTNVEPINVGTASGNTGTLALNSSGAYVSISGTGISGNTYTLMDFGSQTGSGTFSLSSTTANVTTLNVGRQTYTLNDNTNSLTLSISGAAIPNVAYFDAKVSTIWNDATNPTYVNFSTNKAGTIDAGNFVGSVTDVILNSDNAIANNAANGGPANAGSTTAISETLGANTTINSLTVNNNGTTTLGATSGDGTLTINAVADSNTDGSGGSYSGTAAGAAIDILAGANAFTLNSPLVMGNSGANQSYTNNSSNMFTIGGTVTGTATTGNTQTLTLSNTGTGGTTINGIISDVGGGGKVAITVNDTGSGVTYLTGNNAFTGGITLTAGTLSRKGGSTGNEFGQGNVTINGGTLDIYGQTNETLLNLAGTGGNITSSFGSNGGLILNNTANTTYAGTIDGTIAYSGTGNYAVTKTGTGTLALTGSNSYAGGGTLLSAGILQTNSAASLGASSGNLTFNSGTLQLLASYSTTRNYVANSGQAAIIDTNSNSLTDSGVISGAGGLTKNGAGTLVLNNTETYSGATAINAGTVQLGSAGVLPANTLTAGGNLALNGTLDLNGNNVSLSGIPSGSGGVITNTDNGTTSTLTINSSSSGTYAGVFADTTGLTTGTGVLSLTKSGTGTLTLTNTSTYTGGTSITGGTVDYGNGSTTTLASNILGTGPVSMSGGSTLFFGVAQTYNDQDINNNFTLNNATIQSSEATIRLNGTLNVASGGGTFYPQYGSKDILIKGIVSGSGPLAVSDDYDNFNVTSGVHFTNGANTYSGTLTINTASGNGAYAYIDNNTALQYATVNVTGGGTGNLPVGSGLRFGTAAPVVAALTGNTAVSLLETIFSDSPGSNNPVTFTATPVNLTIGGSNSADGFSGVLSGAGGGLTKVGTGTLTLSGANTYTGATNVNGGTLSAGVASVANTSGAFGNNSAVTLANVAGTTLDISGTGFNTQIGTLAGGGTTGGNITLGANTLTINGATNTSFGGVISGTGGGLTKIGAGIQTLSGASTYTGTTNINAGDLNVGVADVASTSGALGNGGNITFGGGTLQYGTGITQDYSSRIVSSASAMSIDTNGNNVTYGSVLAASNTGGLTKLGTGTLALSAANLYTGVTTINGGVLSTGAAGTLANAGSPSSIGEGSGGGNEYVTLNGGTLQYASTGAAASTGLYLTLNTAGALDASGTNAVTFSSTGSVTLTGPGQNTLTLTGSSTAANTFAGELDDNGSNGVSSVAKTGVGEWILSGSNTYSGTTTIGTAVAGASNQTSATANGGTLGVAVGSLASSTTAITVNNGGTLFLAGSGSGRFQSGALSPIALGTTGGTGVGGTILRDTGAYEGTGASTTNGGSSTSGSNSVGLGALTLASNSTIDFGTSGKGTLVFTSFNPTSSNFVLNVTDYTNTTTNGSTISGVDGTDDRLIFMDNVSADGNLADITFAGSTSDAQISLGGGFYEIVPATAVPEPATWAAGLLCAGAFGLGLRRRITGLASFSKAA